MQFKQGDEVICFVTDRKAEIEFGPVMSQTGNPSYLVKWANGSSSLVWTEDLKPVPKFKVGQKVVVDYDSTKTVFSVEAGPFPDQGEGVFWVVKYPSGCFDIRYETHMVAVV